MNKDVYINVNQKFAGEYIHINCMDFLIFSIVLHLCYLRSRQFTNGASTRVGAVDACVSVSQQTGEELPAEYSPYPTIIMQEGLGLIL